MIGQIKMKYIRNLFSKMVNGFQIYSDIVSNGFRIYSNNFCGIEVRVLSIRSSMRNLANLVDR